MDTPAEFRGGCGRKLGAGDASRDLQSRRGTGALSCRSAGRTFLMVA
jgi:hypothetical protein